MKIENYLNDYCFFFFLYLTFTISYTRSLIQLIKPQLPKYTARAEQNVFEKFKI